MSFHDPLVRAADVDRPVDFEFMAPDAWLAFHCEVYDVVAELGIAVAGVDPGVVRLRSGRCLTMLQLAQHCHGRPRDEWHRLIEHHLRTMTAHLARITESYSSFDLRIRLAPDSPADAETLQLLGARPFAEGIVQVLAVDVAHAVRCIPSAEITANGWDVDEAWASARIQTELLETPDEIDVVDIGGADLIHVFGERPFAAGIVGVIDDVVALTATIGEHGAIVSIPLRHSVLVHPIDDATARCAIAGMIPVTRQLFTQGPGSVSPHLYWWRAGVLECIPTFFDGTISGVESFLPPELAAIVSDLSR